MSTPSPEDRAKLQKLFEHGNKQMAIASFDYANDMFEQCVQGDPSNVIYAKSFLENLKRKFGDKKKKGFFSRVAGGVTFKSKKPEQTIKSGVESLKSNPWDPSTLVAVGRACLELGYNDAAIVYLRFAVEAEPNDIEANRNLGVVLRQLNQFDDALLCWARVRKQRPDDQEAIQAMKDIHVEKTIHKGKYETGDSKQVRQSAAELMNASAGVPEGEDVMGRPLTYLEQVERRIKKNPGDIMNYIELANHFYQGGDYGKAEEYFFKVVELSNKEPDQVERLLDTQKQKLQSALFKLKEEFETTKSPEVRDRFHKLKEEFDAKQTELILHRIKMNPGHTGYRFEYGTLLMQHAKFKEAITEFQQAKIDSIRKGECLLALGQCFQQIKQYKLALSHYREAVETINDVGEPKKKSLYLGAKLALGLKEYDMAEDFASQLAAIDFSYKDVGELLDKASKKGEN